jgi:tRNA(fMet)-specific endonuclease VapC
MSFLLDTDHLSAHLRRPSGLSHRFIQYSGRLYTSTVCLAELYVWAYRRPDPDRALESIDNMMLNEVNKIEYDDDCSREFGRTRAAMLQNGIDAPTLDMLIASVALVFDLTIVTHNTADFQNISGLRLDDWL